MVVLGIETSCDETAACVLAKEASGFKIFAELVSSQASTHEPYGGVVPELAAREHLKNLPIIVDKVMRDADATWADLSLIAVTRGPGLKGCLLMGMAFSKALALVHRLPIIGINHIEAHIHSARMDNPELDYPYLCLVASGGHTEIVEVKGLGSYSIVARTMDDAAGEAFDKSAALLGMAYPAGPKLAALADTHTKSRFSLPKVMRESEGFSFSGLKTAVALLVKREAENLNDGTVRAELCFAIQEAIVDALCFKLEQAIKRTGIYKIALVGGVSANERLRKKVGDLPQVELFTTSKNHSVDNAAMVAFLAAHRFERGEKLDWRASAEPRWPVEIL